MTGISTHQRFIYLDIARGIAVLCMILQHAMIIFCVNEGEGSLLGEAVILAGTAPAAPVFMIIMGAFFVSSDKANLIYALKRGTALFAAGYMLNALRFSIPLLVAYDATGTPSYMTEAVTTFFSVDILQMAGLSLIIMGILKRFFPIPLLWGFFAIGIGVISPFFWGHDNFAFEALLWGTEKDVSFPLFPWLIYPLTGMAVSSALASRSSAHRTSLMTGLGGICFVAALIIYFIGPSFLSLTGDYYRSGLMIHLIMTGFVFFWLFLLDRLTSARTLYPFVSELLCFWSRHVTIVYFVQWTLIGWGMFIFGNMEQSPIAAICIGAGMTITTDWVVRGIVMMRSQKKDKQILGEL